MPGLLDSLSHVVYREYDRRIRRASLVTEYGADHHGHAAHEPADANDQEDGDVVIANLPRGAALAQTGPEPARLAEPAPAAEDMSLPDEPEASAPPPPQAPPPAAEGDGGEVEIVNTPPGTPVKP